VADKEVASPFRPPLFYLDPSLRRVMLDNQPNI